MGNIQFGAPLGVFVDPPSGIQVEARCMGNATVAFEAPDDFKVAARRSLVNHTRTEIEALLRAGKSFLGIQNAPTFASAIAAAVATELGVPLEVTSIQLGMSQESSDALIKFTTAAAEKNRAAVIQAMAQKAASKNVCSRCGSPGSGKFCANCGGPMTTNAPAAPPPPNVLPTNETIGAGRWLSFGAHRALAAGSRVQVPAGFVFFGFVNWLIAFQLPPGDQVLSQGCEKFAFMSTTGLPFVVKSLVRDHGKLEIRGTWYVQDPLAVFKSVSSINDDFDLLEIVIGRSADRVNAQTERDLCVATAAGCLKDGDLVEGTVVVIDSMKPVE